MLTVFSQSFGSRRTVLAWYCLGSLGMLLMYVSIFPSLKGQSAQLEQLLKTMPEGLLKAFGPGVANFSVFGNYLSTEMFSFVWPLLAMFLGVSFAGGSIAGEIESGTMELLLAQPVSRARLFWGRYLAALAACATYCGVTVLAIAPLAELFGVEYSRRGVLAMLAAAFLFSGAVTSLSFLFSAWSSEKGKVYAAMAVILVAMYVANLVAVLQDRLADVGYLSFFHYFVPATALTDAKVGTDTVWVLLAVSTAAALLAAWRFQGRDIAV